jgi:hypothetical protein
MRERGLSSVYARTKPATARRRPPKEAMLAAAAPLAGGAEGELPAPPDVALGAPVVTLMVELG